MCGRAELQVEAVVPVSRRAAHERVTDADRARAAELVTVATGDGLLELAEADERLATAWAARTAGELAVVESGLPKAWLTARRRHESAALRRRAAQAALPAHLRSYLSVMALLVGIWLVVGLTAGAWYPWPVWPALGWGIGVAGHVRAAYARPQEPDPIGLPV